MRFNGCYFIVILLLSLFKLQSAVSQSVSGNGCTLHYSGPLISALTQFEHSCPVKFYYRKIWLQNDSVNASFNGKSLDQALGLIFNNTSLTYRIIDDNHVVIMPGNRVAELTHVITNYSGVESNTKDFTLIGKGDGSVRKKASQVTGKVIDAKTGEPVIGAIVQVNNLPMGSVTNVQGRYALSLDAGFYTLKVSCIGYENNAYYVKVINNGIFDMELYDRLIAFEDLVIRGERLDKNVSSHQMSLIELDPRTISQLPSVSGTTDIIKGLTTMPGVKSIGEFSSGINVRGGGEDQNLYLFNGAPIFNTTHVFGLLSVINADVVKKLTLYKGHIPAMYGERISSVVDIRSAETHSEGFTVKGGIGVYDSKLMVTIPLGKNKQSFFEVGGRTSYSDWILDKSNDEYLRTSDAGFHDLNGNLHFRLGKSHLSFSGYSSRDEFDLSGNVRYIYKNRLRSVNLSIMHKSDLASYITLAGSKYNSDKVLPENRMDASTIISGINYTSLRYRIQYSGMNKNVADAGFSIIQHKVNPGERTRLGTISRVSHLKLPSESAWEGAFFVNDEFILNPVITLNMGLRLSAYKHQDASLIWGIEPRFSSRIKISDVSSVKLSYSRNIQYLFLVSPSAVSTPADIWKLSNDNIRPVRANQVSAGYYRNFSNNTIETSVEIYYKTLIHAVEYADGELLTMNPNLDDLLYDANGTNYGIEFLVKKSSGRWDGWIGYTFSRSFREVKSPLADTDVFNGKYPSSYDKPHDFSAVVSFHVNKRVRFAGNFSYATGRPITLPEQKTYVGDQQVVIFSKKNQYRIPDYHRLDLTLTVDENLRLSKWWKGSFSFSLLNVYGRKNPYTVYFSKEKASAFNDYNNFGMYMLYLIGKPVPVISYTFRF
jgi:hypothetical protein